MSRITSPSPRTDAPAQPGRRERAKADKRARIVAAARTLLTERGYDGMTMSEVASMADVATGTVFQYASTKAELLMLAVAELWRPYLERGVLGDRTSTPRGRPTPAPVDDVLHVLAPLLAVSRRSPVLTAAIAREVLFGADGPHRREVLDLVDELEVAVARQLDPTAGATDTPADNARTAARLAISGILIELYRTFEGRSPRETSTSRVRAIVAIAAAGSSL